MTKVLAMAWRILQQLRRDKRTLAILLVAPLLLISLICWLLNSSGGQQSIALLNGSVQYEQQLEDYNVTVIRCTETEGRQLLEQGDVTALVSLVNDRLTVQLDGSQNAAQQIVSKLEMARSSAAWRPGDLRTQVDYVYGYDGLSMFDQFGSALIGILVFFLVFLVAGISFVQERTSGTLEKLLSTPVKRWEIVLGYIVGFGVITVVQSIVLTVYVVYVLRIMQAGSIWLVLLMVMLSAMTALTLGILLSTAANSEFQMMQMIPAIIIPQIFLSGIFTLDGFWETLSYLTPIHYIAHGLQQVMLKGAGFVDIIPDLLLLIVFCIVFFMMNVMLLKKQRSV